MNVAEIKSLCFVSYNSRGYCIQKQDFCKFICSSAFVGKSLPIVCNQENFILGGNVHKINQTFQNHHVFIKPAVKENIDNGRPKNGMFIAIPHPLMNYVVDVSPKF